MNLFSKLVFLALIVIMLAGITDGNAQESPVQLALFNPIQLTPENQAISAFRFSLIYGKNTSLTGLDLGLVNFTTGNQKGVQWGGVGVVDGNFTGWQSNFVSISKGSFEGLQWSGVNYHTGHYHGLQVAIVNYAATMKGLQLGLINIIGKGGFLPVFPFFNFSFD
jgi:hypothetical protein